MFPSRQRIKGTSFFTTNWDKGLPGIDRISRSRLIDGCGRVGTAPTDHRRGDALLSVPPAAPERAAAVAPDARIVAILRDPVDRAYSHYRERARHGAEMLSFEDALAAEGERLRGEESRIIEETRIREPCTRTPLVRRSGPLRVDAGALVCRLPARSGPRPDERGLRSEPRRGPGSPLRLPRAASVGASTARTVQLPP